MRGTCITIGAFVWLSAGMLFLAAQERASGETSAVQGTVLDAVTGAPVARAQVFLQRNSGRDRSRKMTSSDSGGNFTFLGVEPGEYRLSAQKNRYAVSSYGAKAPGRRGAILDIRPGSNLREMNIHLAPAAVVTGRVIDGDGEPIAYAQVQALVFRYVNGRRQLVPAGGAATTDDRGEFRMFGLNPGAYYFVATARNRTRWSILDETESLTYPAVYYPDTTDPAQAVLLRLRAGEERTGMDFRLDAVPAVTVRGKVAGAGDRPDRVSVFLTPREASQMIGRPTNFSRVDRETGAFEIGGVLPGSYYVRATMRGQERRFGMASIDVAAHSVDGVLVTLGPGETVAGAVSFDGDFSEEELDRPLRVELQAQEFALSGASDAVEDKTFELEGLAPGDYRLRVMGLPEGSYLKAAKLANEDILESGLTVPGGGLRGLNIVIGHNAASVASVIQEANGEPLAGATAVLVPGDSRRNRDDLYQSGTTDQFGLFNFSGVAPGEYKLYAFEHIETGAWRDAAFMGQYEDQGKVIELSESDRETVELTVIPEGEQ